MRFYCYNPKLIKSTLDLRKIMINNYVISLKKAELRREHIKSEFKKNDVSFDFFDAIEPSMNQKILEKLDISNEQVENLSVSELACLLSHVCIWQKCIDDNLDFIGVFEDDIDLGEDSKLLLNDTSWFSGKDIIKLEKFHKRAELSLMGKNINATNRKLHELLGKNLGAAGYILSNLGCVYMINYIKEMKVIECIDVVLFNQITHPKSVKVYQLQPAMVIQDKLFSEGDVKFASSIVRNKKKNNRISFNAKMKREFGRAIRSLRMKNIDFK